MYKPSFAYLTIFFLVKSAGSLDCYTGRVGYGLIYTKCGPGIDYCVKRTIADPVYGPVIDKGCDTENFCGNIGTKCFYNSYENMELCCCTSNLCNSAISTHHSIPLIAIVSSVILKFMI